MKRILSILIAAIATVATLSAKGSPEISFVEQSHDFGYVKQDGGKIEYEFEYTNTGSAPLVLTTVSASCDCTTLKWSPKPLKSGKTEKIKVTFDPATITGEFMRTINVWTNVKADNGKKKKVILQILGTVIPPNE